MATNDQPWWLNINLFGFEDDDEDDDDVDDDEDEDDEDDESEDDDEDEDDDSDEDSDEDDDESDEDDDDDDKKSKKKSPRKNVAGLKSALRKERMARRSAEREVKRLKRRRKQPTSSGNGDGKDDKEGKKEEEQDTGPSERERQLAGRLLNKEIDGMVIAAATRAKFIDPLDAVRLVNRKAIEYDQDEEDPTDIEIDEESVTDAVKELARKKKHLIARPGSSTRSGSKMGGKKKKDTLSDEAIRKKYAL